MNRSRIVILNSFQDPGAVIRLTDTVTGTTDRAWILKRVQDDGGFLWQASC